MATRIQVRRGTTSQWNTANPTLEEGEIGYNTTLGQMKIGDGASVWADLDYIVNSASLDTSLGSYIPDSEKSAINGVAELDGSKNILAPAGIIFEGTANDHETTLSVTDPTADRTLTLPDATDTLVGRATTDTLTNKTLGSAVATTALTLNATAELRLADTDSSHYVGFKAPGTVSTNKVWTLPATDGSAGQTLSTDGSATLSWSTPGATLHTMFAMI